MDSSRWFEQDSSICNGVQAVQTFHLLAKLTLSQISLVWNKNHVYLPYCLHSTLAEGHHPTEAEESTAKAALFYAFLFFCFSHFLIMLSCQTSWQCSQSLTHFFLIHFLFARFEMCLGHLVNSESGFISIGFSLSRGSTSTDKSTGDQLTTHLQSVFDRGMSYHLVCAGNRAPKNGQRGRSLNSFRESRL